MEPRDSARKVAMTSFAMLLAVCLILPIDRAEATESAPPDPPEEKRSVAEKVIEDVTEPFPEHSEEEHEPATPG